MASAFSKHRPLPFARARMLLLAMAVGVLAAAGCRQTSTAEPTSTAGQPSSVGAVRVETVIVQAQNLVHSIEMPATVEAYHTAELYAKVGGYLEEISVDIGDRIEKDQPLASLYVPEMVKQLEQAHAEVAWAEAGMGQALAAVHQAEAHAASALAQLQEAQTQRSEKQAHLRLRRSEYERIHVLVERGALLEQRLDEARFQLDAAEAALGSVEARIRSAEAHRDVAAANLQKARSDLKAAQAQVGVAEAKLRRAETMLAYATIRAPFDGVVTKRWVHPGAFIQPAAGNSAAAPLLSVARTDRVRVVVDLPMAEVRLLNQGDRVVLDRIMGLPGESFEGSVARFSPSLDVDSRMMRVEIDLANVEDRLLPGYYGYVTVFLEELPETPVVPSSALLAEGAETFVYVVEQGICRRRNVMVNYRDGSIVGVASGLAAGEYVVRAGGGQLADGQTVVAVAGQPG